MTDTKFVVETGVGYGWSSLAILYALSKKNEAKGLVSIDMPYPSSKNNEYVGKVIPNSLKAKWKLIRLPDKPGIKVTIKNNLEKFDLAHYDSDKSYSGRKMAFQILDKYVREDTIIIMDDIQDNKFFKDYIYKNKINCWKIFKFQNKYVGVISSKLIK